MTYFERIDSLTVRPTAHTGGAWTQSEQHIAPAFGELIAAGRAADTPVALTRGGTTTQQATRQTTLDAAAEALADLSRLTESGALEQGPAAALLAAAFFIALALDEPGFDPTVEALRAHEGLRRFWDWVGKRPPGWRGPLPSCRRRRASGRRRATAETNWAS